ncbi:MAG: hypothetical protein DRH37_07405, partial [Deltaproteobacteria bacterium]
MDVDKVMLGSTEVWSSGGGDLPTGADLQMVGEVDSPTLAMYMSIDVEGSLALVTDRYTVQMIDFLIEEMPTLRGSLTGFEEQVYGSIMSNETAIVVGNSIDNNCLNIDYTDPDNLTYLDFSLGSDNRAIHKVEGGYIVMANYSTYAYNESLQLLSEVGEGGFTSCYLDGMVYLVGLDSFVNDQYNIFYIDVSDLTNIEILEEYQISDTECFDISAYGDKLAVATEEGFRLLEIQNFNFLNDFNSGTQALNYNQLVMIGDVVFLLIEGYFMSTDISDPVEGIVVKSTLSNNVPDGTELLVAGNRAYL